MELAHNMTENRIKPSDARMRNSVFLTDSPYSIFMVIQVHGLTGQL